MRGIYIPEKGGYIGIDASIIIPSYNRREILEKCLQSLFAQDYDRDQYEIIVVDDGSNDGTGSMVQTINSPCSLVYLRNDERSGAARTRNRGIQSARGKYIIFVDSDIVVVPQFITEHIRFHLLFPRAFVLGNLINVTSFDEIGQEKRKFIRDLSMSTFATGNASVRREHLLQAGGFDESFLPYGWEDIELGYRLKRLGLKRKKNPHAFGYHYNPTQVDTVSFDDLKEKEFMRGQGAAILYSKYPSLSVKLSVKGNPLLLFSPIGRWLEETSRGREFFEETRNGNKKWLRNSCAKFILYYLYMKGYEMMVKQREKP
ncbi:MAG: glycosyltransferase [Candidatus Atribacteria bacterium]|nr:glycosyltransferase [Candidatus Atribacteria bacterium]